MKIIIDFDTEEIFEDERTRNILHRYFMGMITAREAALDIGWTRPQWDMAMGGIVSYCRKRHVNLTAGAWREREHLRRHNEGTLE